MFIGFLCLAGLGSAVMMTGVGAQEAGERAESLAIDSGEAHYDGKEIVLSGEVAVQHALGKISARRLSCFPRTRSENGDNSNLIRVGDDVSIELAGGGRLLCQQAEVDQASMKAIFLGNRAHPDVVYLDAMQGDEQNSLELKGARIEIDFIREPSSSSSASMQVGKVEANGHVRIRWGEHYTLMADRVHYCRLPGSRSGEEGVVIALSENGSGISLCQLATAQGDRLWANRMELNGGMRRLKLEGSRGSVSMHREDAPGQVLAFSSNELDWDEAKQVVRLAGGVEVTHDEALRLKTDRELSISYLWLEGKRRLHSLYSPQRTLLAYLDRESENNRHIFCPGPLLIDHDRQKIILQRDVLDGSSEGNQVCMEDAMGEMYADRIEADYTWQGRRMVVEKVAMEGHVRLHNRFDGHREEASSILHYALSDRLDYFPSRRELILSASQGNRVLFLDRVNNVQMSAPSLKIGYDVGSHKEVIQGVGDVRFTFIEKELMQWRHYFPVEQERSSPFAEVRDASP